MSERVRRRHHRLGCRRRHAGAPAVAPSGKRVLILERGDWLPREIENWDAEAVFVDNRYVSPDTWYDEDGQGVPAADPLLRRRRDEVLRRRAVPAARARLRGAQAPRRHLARVADRLRRSWSRTTRRPSSCTRCTANRGEDPTEPPSSAPYPFPPVSHEPRIQQLYDDLQQGRAAPVPLPVRDHARRGGPGLQRLHPLRHLRRLPVPGARQVRRGRHRGAAGDPARQRDAAPQRAGAAGWRPTRPAAPSPRWSPRSTAPSSGSPASIVVVSAGAANSAKILLASANDAHPNGLANGSDQVGRNYMFHNSRAFLAISLEKNDTKFQKTLGVNDYYFGDDGLRLPDGQPADGRQVVRAHVPGREADRDQAGAHARAQATSPSGPSTSGCPPRTCPSRTTG